MPDNNLRNIIGSRTKARRKELGLTQNDVAEQMEVNKSTIQRYESGEIDNTRKLTVEGLAKALHVNVAWLRGETEICESDVSDEKMVRIKDSMQEIADEFPLNMGKAETEFSQNVLIALLREYLYFNSSFKYALEHYEEGNEEIAAMTGFDSSKEYNNIMFLREIMHTVNTLNRIAEAIQTYAKDPDKAKMIIESELEYIP